MSISTPTDLVEAFKKSGEFDRLRRELLVQFQKSEGIEGFKLKIEENIRSLLTSDQQLRYQLMNDHGTTNTYAHKTLMDQVERFPTVERAVAEVRTFSDPTFTGNIRESIQRILKEDKGIKDTPQVASTPSHEDRSPYPHAERAPDAEPNSTTSTNKERETSDFKHQRQPSVAIPASDGAAKSPLDPANEVPVNTPPPATFSTNSSPADRDGTNEEILKVDTVSTTEERS